jgi:hypothetical protein
VAFSNSFPIIFIENINKIKAKIFFFIIII